MRRRPALTAALILLTTLFGVPVSRAASPRPLYEIVILDKAPRTEQRVFEFREQAEKKSIRALPLAEEAPPRPLSCITAERFQRPPPSYSPVD
jgi:hypothetical protein